MLGGSRLRACLLPDKTQRASVVRQFYGPNEFAGLSSFAHERVDYLPPGENHFVSLGSWGRVQPGSQVRGSLCLWFFDWMVDGGAAGSRELVPGREQTTVRSRDSDGDVYESPGSRRKGGT